MITKIEDIQSIVNEIARQQIEYTERTLAEIITKYDFIVGSMECKRKLMEVFPEGANIICSPYIESPTTIYAIKKFDIMDLFENPYKAVRGWYMDELENRDAEVFDKWLDSTEESPRKFYL